MIKGIEHVGLAARDVPSLAVWYEKVLGVKAIRKSAGGAWFLKAPGGGMIEMYPMKTAGPSGLDNHVSGLRHLAFEVEDFDGEYRRLQALGVRFAAEPSIDDDKKLILFFDGEGNLCHLIERKVPFDYSTPL